MSIIKPAPRSAAQACEHVQAQEGLRKLAASAALIRASLDGGGGFVSGEVESPELRIRTDGDFEAWIDVKGSLLDMFVAWPDKFGQLAFGFACDHFKMLHEPYWMLLRQAAENAKHSLVVAGPEPFGVDRRLGLSEAVPERMTAPALMALCQRMASTPDWLMGALDDLEKGKLPVPSKSAPRPKSAP